jgi:hypothetical protein
MKNLAELQHRVDIIQKRLVRDNMRFLKGDFPVSKEEDFRLSLAALARQSNLALAELEARRYYLNRVPDEPVRIYGIDYEIPGETDSAA